MARLRAPKFIYEDWAAKWSLSNYATKKEEDLWVGREIERWVEGFGGLTGFHYFYLTQGHIANSRGTPIRPVWRDWDEYVLEAVNEAENNDNDIVIVKRREFGLTAMFGGAYPIYKSLIEAGGTVLITSADQKRLTDLYNKKTRVFYDNMDDLIRPEEKTGIKGEELEFGEKKKGQKATGLGSTIKSVQTSNRPADATALEAYRATFIFLDELFLHPRATKVYSSAQASISDGFTKSGIMVMGGSCGGATVEGVKQLQELWEAGNSGALDISTLFIPGWAAIMKANELDENGKKTGKILNFCENGYSDEKRATEWILQTREKFDKFLMQNPSNNAVRQRAATFRKEYPLNFQEALDVMNEGGFPDDIKDLIAKQRTQISIEKKPIQRVNLYDSPDGIKYKQSIDGWLEVLEHPQAGREYIASTDPIPFGSKDVVDGSSNSFGIKDRETQQYVALYTERNLNEQVVISRQIMTQTYYGCCKNMIESNRGEVMEREYKLQGQYELLEGRPNYLGIKWTDASKRKGYNNNGGKLDALGNNLLFKYFREHIDKIYFIEILNQTLDFPHKNTDILDMMKGMELYDENLRRREAIKKPKPIYAQVKIGRYDQNGVFRTEWVEQRVR